MRRFFTLRNFFISLLISIVLTQLQYRTQSARHDRIARNGMITKAEARIVNKWATYYVDYHFVTYTGKVIYHSEKCDTSTFASEYNPLVITYNKQNPAEFDTIYEFSSFNSHYSKFYFFFLYPLLLTFILLFMYGILTLLIRNLVLKRSS
jgi:hypothetical protein